MLPGRLQNASNAGKSTVGDTVLPRGGAKLAPAAPCEPTRLSAAFGKSSHHIFF